MQPLLQSHLNGGGSKVHIDALDIDAAAERRYKAHLTASQVQRITFKKQNFLIFQKTCRKKYNLVIGNPPYISRRRLTKADRDRCDEIHTTRGLSVAASHNIWGAFLLTSIDLLKPDGVLAFVLPAEILQVKFAEFLRSYAESKFRRIEVISSNVRIFDDVEQDAVILVGYKTSEDPGVFFLNLQELNTPTLVLPKISAMGGRQSFMGKWKGQLLDEGEAELLKHWYDRVKKIGEISTSTAGIVTAANNYFIVNDQVIARYELEEFARPIIQKGSYVNGSPVFRTADFEALKKQGRACFLIDFSSQEAKTTQPIVERYLKIGRSLGINTRYKCLHRNKWFYVPSVYGAEGYFFKRSHEYPKLIHNKSGALATDAAYRIEMLKGYTIRGLSFSFYNSLTLTFAELVGRTYGGGVLELTPSEFRQLPIPIVPPSRLAYSSFTKSFQDKKSIESFLSAHDELILSEGLGLTAMEINRLQKLRNRLATRRLRRC